MSNRRKRRLTSLQAREIRAHNPVGPLSPQDAEMLARRFGISTSYVRAVSSSYCHITPDAFPDEHPLAGASRTQIRQLLRQRRRTKQRTSNVRKNSLPNPGQCPYCRRRINHQSANKDHITPISRGGTKDRENLQITCHECNQAKLDWTDGEFRALIEFARQYGCSSEGSVLRVANALRLCQCTDCRGRGLATTATTQP